MIEPQIEKIALNRIRPGATNPRKHFDEAYIAELGASIRQKGIIQPLTVRPDWCIGKTDDEITGMNGNGASRTGNLAAEFFEIVAGECRYRGATVAELGEAPAIVRYYSDKETLEVQLIENVQRKDITPIEEAEAYRRLISMGHTVETLHERTGLTRRTIYGKLKIIRAPNVLLDALTKKLVSERVCEIVGRIPIAEMRDRAAREVLNPRLFLEREDGSGDWDEVDEPMTVRMAAAHVSEHYMRSLNGVPFDLKDASLVAPISDEETGERIGGGACDDCPMRSGNSPFLTGEIKRPDICMNPRCLAQKIEVHFARLQERAVAEGKKLLSSEESEEIFAGFGDKLLFSAPYVKLTDKPDPQEVREDFAGRLPRWSTLLEKIESKPQTMVARVPETGAVVELVDRRLAIEAVNLAAKQKGERSLFEKRDVSSSRSRGLAAAAAAVANGAGGSVEPEPEWKKQERKNRELAKLNFQVTLAAMTQLVGALEKKGAVKGFWDAVIETAIEHAGHDGCWLVCKRLVLDPKAKNHHTARDGVAGAALEYGLTLPDDNLKLAYVVELLLSQRMKIYSTGAMGGIRTVDTFKAFAKLYKLDVAEIERQVRAEVKQKQKPKAAELPKKTPPPGPYYLCAAVPVPGERRTYGVAQGRHFAEAVKDGYAEHGLTKPQAEKRLKELNEREPSVTAAAAAEHDFEHIVDNKYRCKGCGAAAVKQENELTIAKQFRGKPCSRALVTGESKSKKSKKKSSLTPAAGNARKRLSDRMKKRWAARRTKASKKGGVK